METTPERIELLYLVLYIQPGTKKKITTRWRMTEAAAAKQFADQEYEILWNTKEERKVGGDPYRLSMSHLLSNHPSKEKPD